VTGSPLSIILEADSSIYTESIVSYFSSSTGLCDIVGYQGFTSNSLATIFTNPDIIVSTALLSIDQSVPQKVDLFVQASTLTAKNSLEVNIVVCGNERISANTLTTNSYVLIPGETFSLTDYLNYFTTDYSSSNSH
jgi:hypothetical protein